MAEKQSFSIKGNRKNKALVEHVAEAVFTVCALLAVVAVASITVYMNHKRDPGHFLKWGSRRSCSALCAAGSQDPSLRDPVS